MDARIITEMTMLSGTTYFVVEYMGDEVVFDTPEQAQEFIDQINKGTI